MMRKLAIAFMMRALLLAMFSGALLVACFFRRRRPLRSRKNAQDNGRSFNVAAIVTFYNANWCRSHLTPIAQAANVRKVVAVVDGPIVPISNVKYVAPTRTLTRAFGRILGKLILLIRSVRQDQADVVIGYTLVPNGLWALIVGRLLGRYTVYQNTVGPEEIVGGGAQTDTLLRGLGWNSKVLEILARTVTRQFDAVVVRGKEAVDYLTSHRLTRFPAILVGSVDRARFSPGNGERTYDLVTVARLVRIKQLHNFLAIIKELKKDLLDVRAAIVGDGPLRDDLMRQACELGVEQNVDFLGRLDRTEEILRRSRVFVLTSRSEGLSIALAEGMACGLPAVVSDVGELGALVRNGETGWRLPPADAAGFVARIRQLLRSPELWQRCSVAARRQAVASNGLNSLAKRWSHFLRELTAR